MREIKVTVYRGDIASLANSGFLDNVQLNSFSRNNAMAVQQYGYDCAIQSDSAGNVYGTPDNVLIDFTVCVMYGEQNIFYEKLMESSTDRFSFLFNAFCFWIKNA